MIKIIISGTSDGFYPRYATDGILDDEISKSLLDRRRFLTRDADRLNKEGYSFQPLATGVLFHKLILLFDGFGRDGFMMASLFLPKGEKLAGTEIKKALDDIVLKYKMHIVGGMANVDVDWSFVKDKSDELNKLVESKHWKQHPRVGDASRTALMQGAENRVDDYFQYPHFLKSGFANFEQVFLTESLLDPQMVSDNGEEGYKVLTTNDVDIDDIDYAIEYNNPNGYFTNGLKSSVKKKELETSAGDFRCGRLERSGYRPAEVYIPSGTQSSDGETINVELPILVPKSASVSLRIIDKATGNLFLSGETTVEWKKGKFYDSSWEKRTAENGLYKFEREECDEVWTVKVSCNGYDDNELSVAIADGTVGKVDVQLTFNPTWTINVISPVNGGTFPVKQNGKYTEIEKLKRSLNVAGLEVAPPQEDAANRTVTIKAKYPLITVKIILDFQKISEMSVRKNELDAKIDELKRCYADQGLEFDKCDDSNGNVKLYFKKKEAVSLPPVKAGGNSPHDGSNSANSGVSVQLTASDPGRPKRKENTYKDKDVRKKEEPVEKPIKKWVLLLDKKSKKFSVFGNGPDEIIKDKGISYDKKNHRLVIECQDMPTVEPKFAKVEKDRYSYRLELGDEEEVVWRQETEKPQPYKVVRKLRTKYMFLLVVSLLLVVGGALALALALKDDNNVFAEQKERMEHFNDQVKGFECYCGDFTLMAGAEQCHSECLKIIEGLEKNEKQKEAQQDSLYLAFESLYQKQCDFRHRDSVNFARLSFLEKKWNDVDMKSYDEIKDKIGDLTAPMSEAHRKQVNKWINEREKEKKSLANAEEEREEWEELNMVDGPDSARGFIEKYGDGKYGGRYSEDVGAVKAFKKFYENTKTLEECKGFLNNYQSEYPDSKMVKKVTGWVEDLKKRLQDTQGESTSLGAQESVEKSDGDGGGKKTLNTINEIFNSLNYHNAAELTIDQYFEEFSLNNSVDRYSKQISNIKDRARKMGKDQYEQSFQRANGYVSSEANKKNDWDILTCLVNALDGKLQ
ncbi:MAG: hypothetical protein KBT57_01085 [bacterium]|nr:hypothetical protein [Candidatus Limimorpha equi]